MQIPFALIIVGVLLSAEEVWSRSSSRWNQNQNSVGVRHLAPQKTLARRGTTPSTPSPSRGNELSGPQCAEFFHRCLPSAPISFETVESYCENATEQHLPCLSHEIEPEAIPQEKALRGDDNLMECTRAIIQSKETSEEQKGLARREYRIFFYICSYHLAQAITDKNCFQQKMEECVKEGNEKKCIKSCEERPLVFKAQAASDYDDGPRCYNAFHQCVKPPLKPSHSDLQKFCAEQRKITVPCFSKELEWKPFGQNELAVCTQAVIDAEQELGKKEVDDFKTFYRVVTYLCGYHLDQAASRPECFQEKMAKCVDSPEETQCMVSCEEGPLRIMKKTEETPASAAARPSPTSPLFLLPIITRLFYYH